MIRNVEVSIHIHFESTIYSLGLPYLSLIAVQALRLTLARY